MAAAVVLVVGQPAPPAAASGQFTIFPATAVPAQAALSDGTPIEVGVKFTTDVDGIVSGVRFYKGTANIGTHVGHLWSASGQLLAEATFTDESASGWQQVEFAQPVAVTANTTYVASYWSSSGYFASTPGSFTTGVDNAPLHTPSSDSSGGNGLFGYGPSAFPTSSFGATNYWVDVVFAPGPDTSAPTVTSTSPADGASGIATDAPVTAQFDEAMAPSTITSSSIVLRGPGGSSVPATVSYSAGALTATLTPQASLDYSTTYTVTVEGGTGGVTDLAGNLLAADRTWSFTTEAAPPPPPDEGAGGPILVVRSSSDGFGSYLSEILRTEGLPEFTVTDLSNLSAAKLSGYQVVILGHTSLSDAQVSVLTTWVQGGGKLIAMRPDPKLATLLGLTPDGGMLSDGYMRIDTSSSPGAGIVGDTMQFHGTADRYSTASGTRAVATLYSDASTATSDPAVTVRTVGTAGGSAAAFTYDLARSVVYTHQGNPAWAGQERDGAVDQGTTTIRSDDLFFGGSVPDYVDLSKVAIPQADEQQRLLANLVTDMESDRMPVPRLWYFPNGHKAVVVMTGDEHTNGVDGTSVAFARFESQSPAGCSVVDWTCVRATSYVQDGVPLSVANAQKYQSDGFEIAMHLTIPGLNACNNYSSYQEVKNALDSQLDTFLRDYDVGSPDTVRTHCIVWSDWDSEVRADLSDGIRLNTDYYYWPSSWVSGRSGMFTGEGIPMRFAATNGSPYDVFQATTQLPDETYTTSAEMSAAATTLLDNAVGANGFYGAFTANVHNDGDDDASRASADAIVSAAQARGVPVISARQLLTWLDGRDSSSFQNLTFSNSRLHFTMVVGDGARGLQAMLPLRGPGGDLQTVLRNGQAVTFTVQTVKGVDYAILSADAGDYEARYTAPAAGTASVSATSLAFGALAINTQSAPQTVTVTNTGTRPLTISSVSFAGNNPFAYAIENDHCSGETVALGATCTVDVKFTPTTLGVKVANLVLTHNGTGHSTSVSLSGTSEVARGAATLAPGSIAFGTVPNNTQTSPTTVTLTNTGTGPLKVSGVSFTGNNTFAFAIGNNTCTGVTVPIGGTCTVDVRFIPTTLNAKTANLTFRHDGTGDTIVALSGTSAPPGGIASLSPGTIAFGTIANGSQSDPTTVTLRNNGNGPLAVSTVAFTGNNTFAFALSNDTCTGVSVPVGGTCTVAVRFTPTTLSPKTANLTFSHNGSGDTSVALSGSVAPSGGIASLSPGTIPFGTIANGSQSDPTTVTLRNNGNGPLTVSTVALTGENRFAFAVANDACTGVSVPVGGTCTVAVRFTPTTLSPKTANLTFSHNGGGDTSVALSGSVVQPGGIASLSPGTIAFGTIPDNSQTSTTTVTLANTGTGALTVGTVSFTGENRFAFTISNNACTGVSVPVGGTCTVGVRFTPTTLGAKTATLSLPHDGGGSTGVALTGTAS